MSMHKSLHQPSKQKEKRKKRKEKQKRQQKRKRNLSRNLTSNRNLDRQSKHLHPTKSLKMRRLKSPPPSRKKGKAHRKNTEKPQHKAQSECGKRRHVFVSLINCNEFDSTDTAGGKGGEVLERVQKTTRRAAQNRKATGRKPRCCFSCHPNHLAPLLLKVAAKPGKTVKRFRCVRCCQTNAATLTKKKSLKVFCQ